MTDNVNKADLVGLVAEKSGLTKQEANKALDAVMEAIAASLEDGKKVTLVGFATIEPVKRAERTGRNPKTGEPLVIPAQTTVKFSTGTALKSRLNK